MLSFSSRPSPRPCVAPTVRCSPGYPKRSAQRANLAHQVVERQVRERSVGAALDLLNRLGHRLGLGARRLLAQPLGALGLRPPALRDVDELPDAAARRALGVVGERHAEQDVDRASVARAIAAFGLIARGLAAEHPLESLALGRRVLLVRELPRHAPDQLPLAVAEHGLRSAVDLDQASLGIDQADADRRVRERRAEALLALLELRVLLVEVDEDLDLRAQHVGIERLEHVVDRADRIAA